MSSKRFWDETPGDDSGAGDSPQKWHGDAIDPDTGEWRPKRLVEEFEIGGHEYRWMEGPIAQAAISDADGNHLVTIQVPFDPADGDPDNTMLEDAMQWYQGFEYVRGIVKQDAIDGLVKELQTSRVDGQRSVSEVMVSTVADTLIEGVKITVTNDDNDLTAAQLEELQAEVDRVFAETIPKIVEAIAEVPNPAAGDLNFWQQMARDIIAHALTYARDDAIEEYGGPEAVEALEGEAAAAWDARVGELYNTGPYLAGAYMQIGQEWLPILGELARAGIEYSGQTPADDPDSMGARILAKARKNLGLSDASDNTAAVEQVEPPAKQVRQVALPITMNAAYTAGVAYTPTPQPWLHLVESLWQPWEVEPGTWPERYFPLNKGRGGVRFTFQENPNGATDVQLAHATELAHNLNPVIPHVVTALGNLYTPNRKHRGRMVTTTAEIARDVYGVKPEKRHLEAVNDAMYTLGYLVVQQLAYERHEKGKRAAQLQQYPARRFLSWDRLHQNGRNATYDIQLGEPILAVLGDFPRQVAGIPEGALALDARQPAHSRFATAIIMRCNLTWETRKWARTGLTHREILQYAGIDPDTVDARRRPKIRKSIAGILDQSALWDHHYAPGADIENMRWDQWLEEPRVLLTVHKHERHTHPDDMDTPDLPPESDPQVHPSWGS